MRHLTGFGLVALSCGGLLGQPSHAPPRFAMADVHTSAKTSSNLVRVSPARNGRYEIHNATMLDLIRTAFGFDPDKILGGPNWLELDRYDVIAKLPVDTTPETQKLMLQALLKDRFKLAVHEDTQPVPAWVLSVAKKPKLKEADGTGETGCKMHTGASQPGGPKFFRGNPNGTTTAINIGPGMTIGYECRNMTMAAFAAGLRGMEFTRLVSSVQDRTGLKGEWNFDISWSLPFIGPEAGRGERITLADALEKQLGLKLEQVPVPTKALVVDSVERKPTDNPAGVKEALPEIAPPTEFEVADVRLADPKPRPGMPLTFFRMQPGGRFVTEGTPLRFLLNRAFNLSSADQMVGIPSWADSVRVSITAKVEGGYPFTGPAAMDPEFMAPLIRSLLTERFGLVWHTEQRMGTAYDLVAANPKIKKADPHSRIHCNNVPPGPNQAPNEQVLDCQNATMALFAERLEHVPAIQAPVDDATSLDGGWDFTFTFNPLPQMMTTGLRRGGDQPATQGALEAADPGGGYTVFESIQKQLGLKLEKKKKIVPVTVIDKLNPKPTEN